MAEPSEEGVKGAVEVIEPSRAEQTIARRSAEARATVPDLELEVEVNMSALAAEHPDAVTAMVVRAAALSMREHPRANAAYRDGRYELYSRINAGVVIAAGDELITATVFDADQKPLGELTSELTMLAARAGELLSPERSGATFTIANPGIHGVARSSAIISPPQAVALAAGSVRPEALVRNGDIVPGYVMALTLACDHRILYGAGAAGFLMRVKELLEQAEL